MSLLSIELDLAGSTDRHLSARLQMLTQFLQVNFTTYFFFRDNLPVNMNMLVFFLGKCVWTTAKAMVMDRKKQLALALLYLHC